LAEIVNLRRERKRRARNQEAAQAAENRAKFGAPKSERELEAARRKLGERRLDGARRDPGDGE
jgi:hypothetical protein